MCTNDHTGEGNVEGRHISDKRASTGGAEHVDLVADDVEDGNDLFFIVNTDSV